MSTTSFRRRRVLALGLLTALVLAGVTGTADAGPTHKTVTGKKRTAGSKTTASNTHTNSASVSAATLPIGPPGQTTAQGLLPASASSFGSANTGWTSFGGATVGQTSTVGHAAAGALSVTSAGPWTGATSPSFPVASGSRYSAVGWVLAKSAGHGVGLALQFHDASGALISSGTQVGQGLTDSPSTWSATAPVIGFAPVGAVTGNVLLIDYDGAAGDVQYLDDVNVSATTGVAARVVGPLTTQGTNIVDALGRLVTFHGVDIDGLQYSNTANVTTSEVAVAQSWGANFVRLPLAENYQIPSDCSYDSSYLGKIDAMVNTATSAGLFIMLDLHTNALSRCVAPTQQKMPDANAVTFWQTLANRYQTNPLVGFDLYNEPHDVSDTVWHNGGTVTSSGVTYPAVGIQTLYNTVRATGATNLIFASGTNYATEFPATAPLTRASNLIYAAHAYTCPTGLPATGATCTTGPDGTIYDPSGLLGNFATIAQTAPVMITEFGFPDKNDGRYLTNVLNWATHHNLVGWDVYAFDNSTGGLFDLWKNIGTPIDPTASGMAVMTGMLAD